jgi:RimK family alpha-L-glutamate ligase
MSDIKLAIVYGEISTKHQLIIDRAEDIFDSVLAVPVEGLKMVHNGEDSVYYKDTDITQFDAVYIRTDDSDKNFSEHLSEILERQGVVTQASVDTYAYESNKFYSMKILSETGLNVPKSAYTLSPETAVETAENLSYPVIMKTVGGGGGEGVMRAPSKSELKPVMDTMTAFEQDICLQEYIEGADTDNRVIVIGDTVVAYQRTNEDEDEWRSNLGTGGSRKQIEVDEDMKKAAVKAARATGFSMCGCDIVEMNGDSYILEVNGSFGINEKINEIVGEDIVMRMVEELHEKAVST